jgi:hypothetical protein
VTYLENRQLLGELKESTLINLLKNDIKVICIDIYPQYNEIDKILPLIRQLQLNSLKLGLFALTGKKVKLLGMKSKYINERFQPICMFLQKPFHCDVLILFEADCMGFNLVSQAVHRSTCKTVILIGDSNQLPPYKGGATFKNLVNLSEHFDWIQYVKI